MDYYDLQNYTISKQTRRQNKNSYINAKTKNKKNRHKKLNYYHRKSFDQHKNKKSLKELNKRYCKIGLQELLNDIETSFIADNDEQYTYSKHITYSSKYDIDKLYQNNLICCICNKYYRRFNINDINCKICKF